MAAAASVDVAAEAAPEVPVEDLVAVRAFPAPGASAFVLPGWRSFQEEHRVRGYEVSPNQRAPIVTIANLLQVRRPVCPGWAGRFCWCRRWSMTV